MEPTKTTDLKDSLNNLFADDGDELLLLDDTPDADEASNIKPWRILVADDEPEVHSVTKLALSGFRFDDRPLELLHAYSGLEARQVLKDEHDIALALLDVVMETDDAGLQVVNYIRSELKNTYMRIVLRTGQPGIAPEDEVVKRYDYDIDDYKAKSELTQQRLHTTLISSLRAYRELIRIDAIVQERTAQLTQVHQDLMDSIRYAQRIQSAILPKIDVIQASLPQSFVFFKPKDIVSGDFYWYERKGNLSMLASVDCTGHGVPGAILSMIGHNQLTRIVDDLEKLSPDQILHTLDETVRGLLKHDTPNMVVADGMDMSLVAFDHGTSRLYFAGAKRPLYLVRRNGGTPELIRLHGSHYPIGDARILNKVFDLHTIQLEPGDRIYLFTDGFIDQFGGDNARKFGSKRFDETILDIQRLPMTEQGVHLENVLVAWSGGIPQIDDISVIGFEPIPA